ncbi:hypothetical protein Tco_0614459 [Tanacetum coccineum]
MIAQEVAAQAVNDATRQTFDREQRKNASSNKADQATSTNSLSTDRPNVGTANIVSTANATLHSDSNVLDLEDDFDVSPNERIFSGVYDDDNVGAKADFNNMDNTIDASPIPTLRIHKKRMQQESVSKQGRKSAKAEPSMPKDLVFDDLDGLDYMEIEAYTEDGVSTEATVSTDKQKVSTDKYRVSTVSIKISTDKNKEGIAEARDEQRTTPTTPTPTPTTFRDDKTIVQFLITMSQNKEKLKIDPKDKGKKRIEEDDESRTESDEVTTAKKKFKHLTTDEELARKIQEDLEAEEEKKRLADEEAKNAALIHDFDDINARI